MTTLRVAGGLLLAVVAFSHQATGQGTPRQRMAGPPPGPAKEVRFPAFEEQTLANGLRVVVLRQHEQPLVSLQLVLLAGRTFEPAGKEGVAAATADLLTQGTKTRSTQQIAEAIDFVGGNLSANASLESAFATAEVTSDQIGLGFELLSDVVLHPSFEQAELDRWRQRALSDLRVREESAGYLADTALQRLLFAEHPYGRPGRGTAASVAGLTREDLVVFHARRYVAGQALLAVVGDVEPADAFARARQVFGGWSAGEPVEVPAVVAPPKAVRRILVIDKPGAVQTAIRLGQVALAFRDPDRSISKVYDSVAGGSISARLGNELRVKRGLTYGASSLFATPSQPGWFTASTSTKTATTVEVISVALDVLRGLATHAVPEAELNSARTYITGAFPLEIETAGGTARKVIEAMRYGYGREFLERTNERISAVTAAELQRFARERMPADAMTIVLVGNAAAFSAELEEKFGAFETIPAAQLDFRSPDLRAAVPAEPPAPAPAPVP